MEQLLFKASGEAETDALGAALARLLSRPAVVALHGTLGAGKTRLVQGLAAGLGIEREAVSSPTFVLLHEYRGEAPIYHFDAYRLRDADEFWELGAEEYLADGRGIVVIEWAERIAGCLPADRLEIAIQITGPAERFFRLSFRGACYESTADGLKAWIESR
ncbi:MAG TPA: tRNA (adenosine(37)-N6)-threonylcarbamoyltransferase complex ATPase subunit type 1 TsaE [Pirellulales bacterium]|nr:tRNA (adenosine(37)-N6)-threonylcarbamoyltransferase complex ATPase subunit type 1 TsaE [Pirellulales bacterium]